MVTTLLEMYLQANPSRVRSAQEKEEMEQSYKPGDVVLPILSRSRESRDEAENRRMVEEVRDMSLRELGIRESATHERGIMQPTRGAASSSVDDEQRQRRNRARDTRGESARGGSSHTITSSPARHIEHQSSLRSLVSASDLDPAGMEEEILRQIMEEGILDGIDLNNMDVTQEDELSEKIAEAYRRRHRQESRARGHRRESPSAASPRDQGFDSRERRHQRRPSRNTNANASDQTPQSSHPPLSRPHLLEAYPTISSHRRRTSSEHRRHTSPNPSPSGRRTSSETQHQAARSATDLSNRPGSSSNRATRPTDFSRTGRRTTDPDSLHPRGQSQDRASRAVPAPRSPRTRPRELSSSQANAASIRSSSSSLRTSGSDPPRTNSRPAPLIINDGSHSNSPRVSHDDSTQPPTTLPALIQSYIEPTISCERCGKPHIEYELHMNCATCKDGKYNICLRCYRTARGCLHWFGFGHAAIQRYRQQEPASGCPPNHQLPHSLNGQQYLPPPPATRNVGMSDSVLRTSSDPSQRLLSGPFCSNCSKFTPKCYWKCDVCNDSEWGYCNACVNQGKCCTHALLPVSFTAKGGRPMSPLFQQGQHSTVTAINPSRRNDSDTDMSLTEPYVPLTFSTKCDICTYPIPPSNTRFHCLQCHDGDYDIDMTCYHRLVHTDKISVENGPRGWRRCPSGHRMIIVGFEDSNAGQSRIVVDDLVGGHALKDDLDGDSSLEWSWREEGQKQAKIVSKAASARSTASTGPSTTDGVPPMLKRYPPNGGIGMHILALWAWWPQDGANDELAFPKGAEIRECEDINGDWFWGIYCGRMGVFPSGYGKILESVKM